MADPEIFIESIDQEARGVGHVEGKVIFVENALIGETVRFRSFKKKASFELASATDILRESASRVRPRCQYFGTCGGCSMQHLDVAAQVSVKQRVLEDNLWHLGKVRPEVVFRPIHGPSWGYRYRARLSVRLVPKKGGVLIGFHERKNSYIADMLSCEVLPPAVSALLVPLREMIGRFERPARIAQIELAIGEKDVALVIRNLDPLTPADEAVLRVFADTHAVQFWLQSAGPDSARLFYPPNARLAYSLPEFGIDMPFRPTDFTQVNHHINRVLVSRAVHLLAPEPDERVGDLFCGLGNFTLPLATLAGEVVGIEGSASLIERARHNAALNGVGDKVTFHVANLFEVDVERMMALGRLDKLLIDPPREGAMAVATALAAMPGFAPKRIVYVSCNPATLARDAGILVHSGGYRLSAAGVVNMFPHTSHVESIAVFDKLADSDRPALPASAAPQ